MSRSPTEKLIDRAKLEQVKGVLSEAFDAELLQLRKLYAIPYPLTSEKNWKRESDELTRAKHGQLALCVAMVKNMALADAKPADKTDRYAELMNAVKEAFDQKQLDEIDADLRSMNGGGNE